MRNDAYSNGYSATTELLPAQVVRRAMQGLPTKEIRMWGRFLKPGKRGLAHGLV